MSLDGFKGSAALRATRHNMGLTQEELSGRSQLAVRTIRGLEAGRVSAPRRDSLTRLIEALGLSQVERADFMAAWGQNDLSGLPDGWSIFGDDTFEGLAETIRHVTAATTPVAISACAWVDAARRTVAVEELRTVTAIREGVSGISLIVGVDDWVDGDQVRLVRLRECAVRGTRMLQALKVRLFDIGFGRALARGESQTYGYRVEYGPRADWSVPPPDTDWYGNVLSGTPSLYTLSVKFDPLVRPQRCVSIFVAPAKPELETARLNIGPWASTQMIVQNASTGGHGLRWFW